MPMNMVDGVDFTAEDPCVWILYSPGAAGDLLGAIVDKHYINTGCDYYGIHESGQVLFIPSDYRTCTRNGTRTVTEYTDEFFYGLADTLGSRNLNYSLLDNVIFTHHAYKHKDVLCILDKFPKGKIIMINHTTDIEQEIILKMVELKHARYSSMGEKTIITNEGYITHDRILNINFLDLFAEEVFEETYSRIIKFLGLRNKLIRYDFIEFYLSKQHPTIRELINSALIDSTHD
jgi:hypothetical protein